VPWSLRVATVFGVPIRIHASFGLLLVYLWWIARMTGRSVGMQFALVAGVFVCVVLHELGHVLVARFHGIRTRDITLYPIGGLSRIEKMGKPRQELTIALAGPLVSLFLGGVLWAAAAASGTGLQWAALGSGSVGYLGWLAVANLILAGFNLLPAFPMDGGRVLRATLALSMGSSRATAVAAAIGQVFAVGIGFLGLLGGNLLLLLIAIFLFFGARAEATIQSWRDLATGQHVRDAMQTGFVALQADGTLGDAAETLVHTDQTDFPILNGHTPPRLLTRSRLMEGLGTEGRAGLVGDFAEPATVELRPDEDLASTIDSFLSRRGRPTAVVMQDGRLVGLLSWRNLTEFLTIREMQRGAG
jgi:Zn-dependent protease